MNKQIWILNLLCVCSLAGLGWKLGKDWRQYAAHNGPQALGIRPLNGVVVPARLDAGDYSAIAQQNPFHSDRNDVITETSVPRVTGPPPLVYGSIIFGDTRFALLASEQSPKPQRVTEGSTFEGYRLVKVLPQSVVFESDGGRNEVMLYNALERLHRQTSKTTANARPATPPPTTSVAAASAPPVEAGSARMASSDSPSSNPAVPMGTAPPGKEVMQTPFGPIIVDKRN